MKLRKSPFKVDKIEDNPEAYALRSSEISKCVDSLYNDRNILITGARGVGKSSLGKQMQILYQGNFTLLRRSKIDGCFPKYLCIYYACDERSTLASLTLDILYRLEQNCLLLKTFEVKGKKKLKAEIDLKVVKASLESEIVSKRPASIVTSYINGLRTIYHPLEKYTDFEGINIFIDEIDRIPKEINFGHFVKLVHEYSDNDGLSKINYILVGQRGTFKRLFNEDPSIERLVKHVPVSKIDMDESGFILDYASIHADPPYKIEESAREVILKLSAGYPYTIHLLGDAAFQGMGEETYLELNDVMEGLGDILKSDKNEKYLENLSSLSKDERIVVSTLSRYESNELPMIIPNNWVKKHLIAELEESNDMERLLLQLSQKGHININKKDKVCQFNDELFRVYISLRNIEEIEERRIEEEGKEITLLPYDEERMDDVVHFIKRADLNEVWEFDPYDELMKF